MIYSMAIVFVLVALGDPLLSGLRFVVDWV